MPDGGKGSRRGLSRAIASDQTCAANADGRVRVQVLNGKAQGAGMEESVRVQKHEILSLGCLQSEVVGYAKAEIRFAANEPYRRG